METLSTGLPGLDRVLQGLRPGDNVVWEVDGIDDYAPLVGPLCREAARRQRPLVYFRFARHAPLVGEAEGAAIHRLDPQVGFERFVSEILDVIERKGRGAFYVFDCLSDLAADWFSDRMLGNFFLITCPYLYELETLAYFGLQKHVHSAHATSAIFDTAQVILEVYRRGERMYVHPMKVWQRSSPTMYVLHSWEGDEFRPVTNSSMITDILAGVPQPWLEFTVRRPGLWVRTFQEAQELLRQMRQGLRPESAGNELFDRLLRMVVTRETRFQELARQYLELADLVAIMQRMVGTGLIGGKSLGLLLARAILRKADPRWMDRLESHDSFYVGSDVFYTYLVQNRCWWLCRRQKDFDTLLRRSAEARQRILNGTFPEDIRHQFLEMLEYFGQSPLIVRSSSLLEDNYGNAFSGKYESVFLPNQGDPEQRLAALLDAVRRVYASALSEAGLRYRQHHGLLDRDEQMALLVQRVSGDLYEHLFFPHVAGVGFSFNPFAWSEEVDPQAGVLRLVFGLGTRAVDRTDDDYTRLVALNAPLRQPEARADEAARFAQRRVDVLDLKANRLVSLDLAEVARVFPVELLEVFADWPGGCGRDGRLDADVAGRVMLTFERMFRKTDFALTMRELCETLQRAYRHPVDIEFTANFTADGRFRVNLLQCRPFQVKVGGLGSRVHIPATLREEDVLIASTGPVVGHGLATVIDRLICVLPSAYARLNMSQRYAVARLIGRLTHLETHAEKSGILLIGPGRWGTSMPALGVPVSFAEINTVSVLGELALMHEGLVPDVSLGTHFFNDLVEMDMLYFAVTPGKNGHVWNERLLTSLPNCLQSLLPDAVSLAASVHVVEAGRLPRPLCLNADAVSQRVVCYFPSA